MPSQSIRRFAYLAYVLVGCAIAWGIYATTRPADEVALTLDEPYEQVRQQSRSTLPAADPEMFWGGFVTRPARLRFTDPRYGFVTPSAKFLYVGTNKYGKVESITLSPQIETLSLDDTMAVLTDLQNQLRRGGWRLIRVASNPAITDTPAMRASIRSRTDPITYWLADNKYQIILDVRRFINESRSNDERYLITLRLSGPPLMTDSPGS
ncbi:flagellar biosynthesis sigma factor [Paraburkholderia acidicola]|uniref:Flagellar biosynthesis sigma factor n=1 Tax=Paraburkholderia acidicola TaxID=1912599 RepID=A0A2A4F6F0_9BURK|nr:flagellar biosynthesis sigma factor [Paraburkholderia acidicola]PCE27899.1 flagellar biosynthesis sigma factor [Paraburkholderia acidicola]